MSDSLQKQHFAWSRVTFPDQTPLSNYRHLRREIAELGDDLSDELELADCFLLLCGIASQQGIDLLEAGAKKLEINKERTWSKPDASGVCSHI